MADIYEETLKDKLTMDPVTKYEVLGRFPWKLIFQIFLIVATSYQVQLLNQNDGQDARNLLYVINSQIFGFNNFDYVYTTDDSPQMNYGVFWTVSDFNDNLNKLFDTMGGLDDIIFGTVNQTAINEMENRINVYYRYPIRQGYQDRASFVFSLDNDFSKPFNRSDMTSVHEFIRNITQCEINFANLAFSLNSDKGYQVVENWSVTMTYKVTDLWQVEAYLTAQVVQNSVESNEGMTGRYFSQYNWIINVFILVIGAASLVLNIKYIFDMVTLFTRSKFKSTRVVNRNSSVSSADNKNDELQYLMPEQDWMDTYDLRGKKRIAKIIQQQKPWNQLNWEEKLLFIDSWVFLTIIGNAIQCLTSLILIANAKTVSFVTIELLVGFSCFLAWISMCRYVEFEDNVYILTYLLKYSLPTIGRFLLGVMPFFVGYAVLGLTLFYNSSYFATFNDAFTTLFCLSFGNMIYEAGYYVGMSVTSTIYVMTFCIIFLIIFQNMLMTIFVSIVYDKFDAQVRQEQLDYLESKIPNLRQLIEESKSSGLKKPSPGSNKPSMDQSPSQSPQGGIPSQLGPNRTIQNSSQVSQTGNSFTENTNMSSILLKNLLGNKIKAQQRKIEKAIDRMQTDLQDDLKMLLKTKRADRQRAMKANELCLEYLLKKSLRLQNKAARMRETFMNEMEEKQ